MNKSTQIITTFILCLFSSLTSFSQDMGININPHPSAIFHVQSNEKGIVIPRMDSLERVAINSPALGLLVFDKNSNSFWYHVGGQWRELKDHDWYGEGTGQPPSHINDNIYRRGRVAIGKTTAEAHLDLRAYGDTAIYINNISKDTAYGNYTFLDSAQTGYGTYTLLTGPGFGRQYGSYHKIDGIGDGPHYGAYNELAGNGGGAQYATYNRISNSSNGQKYGTFNSVFGGSDLNYGTQNQISGIEHGQVIGTSNFITNDGHGNHFGTSNNVTGSGMGLHYGVLNSLGGAGSGPQYGSYNRIDNSSDGTHHGTFNLVNGDGTGDHYGTKNRLLGSGTGTNYGIFNDMVGFPSGVQYGLYNNISNMSDTTHYGTYNHLSGGGAGTHYGTYNLITLGRGTLYGSYNEIPSNGGLEPHIAGYFDAPGNINRNYAAVFNAGLVVVNESGGPYDFRVESRSETHMLFMDAQTNRIGIGVDDPDQTLHVVDSSHNTAVAQFENIDTTNNSSGIVIKVGPSANPGVSNRFVQFRDGDNTFLGAISGDGAGGVNYNTISDRRLKQNVKAYKGGLAKVLQIHPREYQMKSRPDVDQIGFIAQEIAEVLPSIVSGNPNASVDEPMAVDYSKLTPILLSAIQEQQQMIDGLIQRLDMIEKSEIK